MGFVCVAPTLCNDKQCLVYSTAVYAQATTSHIATDAGITTGAANSAASQVMGNLPYTYAQVTATTAGQIVAGRNVASSLELTYTGTVLNSSGQYFAYSDPDNDNVCGPDHNLSTPASGYTTAALAQKDSTEISGVTNGHSARITVIPNANNEVDYPPFNSTPLRKAFPFAQGQTSFDATTASPCAVIMITGTAGMPFYFEYIVHNEYIGAGVTQSLITDSQSDAVGYDAVQSIAGRAQRMCAGDARLSFSQALRNEIKKEKVVLAPNK